MDTSDENIVFDPDGISNHWWEYKNREKDELIVGKEGRKFAETLANDIRKMGKYRDYDCIIGLSGGIDSSYTAYWV